MKRRFRWKIKRCSVKIFVFSLCLLGQFILPVNSVFAASKKKKASEKTETVETPVQIPEETVNENETDASSEKTKIAAPKDRKTVTYFSNIDSSIVSAVENGSPSSIKQAMTQIRKSESEYTEAERVLIIIAAEIYKIVWTSEKVTWDVPSFSGKNTYTGAIEFAKNGYFDSSTGNTDFLSTILPAFVLFDDGVTPTILSQCETALIAASSMVSESVLLEYMRGVLYEKKGEYEEAEKYLESLYKNNPNVYEIGYHYASVHLALGKESDASAAALNLLENSNSIAALKLNAKIAFEQKQYDKAEEYVARVLSQTPNDLEFLLFRAKILIEKNDYIHAVSLLDMYSRQNSTNIDYLLLRAKVQLDWSKNTTLATETIEKALSIYPENKDALLFAARVASSTDSPVAGKYADELVSKILENDPSNEEALSYALDGLIRRSSWQSAYDISKKLVSKENPSSDLISKHVEICIALGKKNEALTLATSFYNKNSQDENILQSYVLAQVASGNKTQSLDLINKLLDSSSSKMKSFLYYRRSFLQGTETAQLADLRSSLIANPRNSDSLFRLYEIYFDKADYRKAQYYLKQVVALKPNDSSIKKLNESLTKLLQ